MPVFRRLALAMACAILLGGCQSQPQTPSPTSTEPPPSPAPPSTASPPPPSLGLVRNHLLSTLDYVGEVADDLAAASDGAAAYRALEPLVGVLDDEQAWFATHAAERPEQEVREYGQRLQAAAAAVHAAVDPGSPTGGPARTSAQAAIVDLLALRPSLAALPG